MDILHLSASPKGEKSASEQMALAFLGAYSKANPTHGIRRLNVFESELPEFGVLHAEAKMAPIYNETITDDHHKAWSDVVALIDDFKKADKVVLSSPMWNYSIPWRLKLYFDCLVQPGRTFGYDPAKMLHIGLLQNRPVQLLLTRSSIMPGDYVDYQLPYLKFMFQLIGLADVRSLCAWQTTKFDPEGRRNYMLPFLDQAAALGQDF